MEQLNRSEARRIIMTILYQVVVYEKNKMLYDIDELLKENLEIDNEFVNTIVNGVLEKEKELDKLIDKYMIGWTTKRLGNIDQAIFRMSVYELLYYDTPNIVCINEGIELCKKYSDEKVTGLLNSVLDKIYDLEVKDE